MKRLFFALDIADNDKKIIAHWRDNKLNLPFKAITKDNFHITLAFLGNTTSQQQQHLIEHATKLAQQIAPLNYHDLQLDHLGLFKKPKVMYLGLTTCPNWLSALATSLSDAAITEGLFQENRPYCPHLSIYRKATANTQNASLKRSINVNSFSLYESIPRENGVSYCPIKTWQFAL